tara:strand:+ start:181 stop:399 length:219 start_codon:yes stop_codon:yes gene_type:complete
MGAIMKLLTRHLEENKISYYNHMKRAVSISYQLLIASVACGIHSIIPFVFAKSASTIIKKLSKEINHVEENL